MDAIELALGITTTENISLAAAPEIPETRPLNILLAEDSVVNQRLAVGILNNHGHHVTVAQNGREAIDMLSRQVFDLVLMDVQMPEMDGLEATETVRAREKQTGNHIPIIGMTAHVMKGDRDRCFEAGMDDYVPKPVQARKLLTAIGTAAAGPAAETEANRPAEADSAKSDPCAQPPDRSKPPAETIGPVDWQHARQALMGNEKLLRNVTSTFLDEIPGMMDDIRGTIETNDHTGLRRAAHTLKGSLGYFGAQAAFELAYRLENMALEGDSSGATETLAALQREMDQVRPELLEYVDRFDEAT